MSDFDVTFTIEHEGLAPPAIEKMISDQFPNSTDITVEEKT